MRTQPELHSNSNDAEFALLVDRLTCKFLAGNSIDIETLCIEHPQHSKQILALLPAIQTIANLSGGNGQLAPSQFDNPHESKMVGDYRILCEIGRGGMGVVYKAEQISLRRKVALKVLPFTGLLDERQLQRFKNEARAAASLRHPNIVTVHGVGNDRAVHYYAMDLINGTDLAAAIRHIHQQTTHSAHRSKDTSQLPPLAKLSTEQSSKQSSFFRSVAKLAIQASDALQHAHSAGVVHRDIKPANLLLDEHGVLHVTDFGLAQMQAHDELTLTTGDPIGTLRYMSPEQVSGEQHVDGRSDVYSLGLTIYELLTGHPANAGESRADLVRHAAEPSPKQLKRLIPSIPDDLQTIINTAISANPEDRYQTAREFSDDLRAFLELRTIKAKPSTQLSRLRRFAKRNPSLAIAFGVTLLSAMLLAIVTSLWAFDAAQQAASTNEITRKQRISLYAADMRVAKSLANARRLIRLQEVLLRWVPPDPNSDETDLREFEWYHLWQYCEDPAIVHTFDHELPGSQVRFLDDEQIVMLGFSSRAKLFSLTPSETGLRKIFQSPATNLDALAYHPTTHQIAIGDGGGNVTTWNWRSGKQLFQTNAIAGEGENNSSETLAFNNDGSQILMGGGSWQSGFVRLWRQPDQTPIFGVSRTGEACAVFGPNDSVVVSSYGEGYLDVFEQDQWTTPKQIDLEADGVWRIAVNKDRSLVAVGAYRQHDHIKSWQMQVYETSSWQQVWAFDLSSTPDTVEFPRDSTLLAWGDEQGSVWLARLNPETRTAKIDFSRKLHDSAVSGIDISPSGDYLATSSWDGLTTVWNLAKLQQSHPAKVSYTGQDFWPSGASFSAIDSKIAAVVIRYEGVYLWNSQTGDVVSKLPIEVGDATNLQIAASDSGKICVAMGIWPEPEDDKTRSRIVLYDPKAQNTKELVVPAVGISMTSSSMFPNGAFYAICSHHAGVLIVDTTNGMKQVRTLPDIPGKTIRCSADNETIAVGGANGVAYVLKAPAFECVESIKMDERLIDSIDISSDGNIIAAVGFDRKVKLYDRRTRTLREFAEKLPSFPNLIRLSPCGARIMTGSLDGAYRLWILETGELVQTWACRPFGWPVGEFSSDGSTFLANGVDFANALHAPHVADIRLLPAATLRSRACQNVSSVAW